jgi:WD40 repeat protein
MATGRELRAFRSTERSAWNFAISPDERILVTTRGYRHPGIDVWDVGTDRHLRRLDTGDRIVLVCAFSLDGHLLAAALGDGSIVLWGTRNWEIRGCLERGRSGVAFLAFGPDSRTLLAVESASPENNIRWWDTETCEELRREPRPAPTESAAFSGQANLLALSSREGISLRDAATGEETWQRPLPGPGMWRLVLSADGAVLACADLSSWNHHRILFLDTATGEELRRWEGNGSFEGLAFSPVGRLLASSARDRTVLVWDVTGLCPDGRWTERELAGEELRQCAADLGHADAVRAHRALWRLAASARQAVPLLQEQLRPEPPVASQRLDRLLRDLQSSKLAQRRQAQQGLEELGG